MWRHAAGEIVVSSAPADGLLLCAGAEIDIPYELSGSECARPGWVNSGQHLEHLNRRGQRSIAETAVDVEHPAVLSIIARVQVLKAGSPCPEDRAELERACDAPSAIGRIDGRVGVGRGVSLATETCQPHRTPPSSGEQVL